MTSIKPLFLSEEKIQEHLRGLGAVHALACRALNVLGFLEPFEGGDWSLELALERLSRREKVPKRPLKILRAACHIARSTVSLQSSREVVIDQIAFAHEPIHLLVEALAAHVVLRPHEIEAEKFFDLA